MTTRHKDVLYQVTLPVSVELRSTIGNSLIAAEHLDMQYDLTQGAMKQLVAVAQADKMSYEEAMLDHLQRVFTTEVLRNGKGNRFQEYRQKSDEPVWVRVSLDGEIAYSRPAH